MSDDWLLELGHTRLKLARRPAAGGVEGKATTLRGPVVAMARERFGEWLRAEGPRSARFWIAAVPGADVVAEVTAQLDRRGHEWRRIGLEACELPVRPSYSEMGVDRWLALQPAWRARQKAFCLVDCGTAMTIDLVDDQGLHAGGWIVPGLEAARAGLLARAPGLVRPDPGPVESLAPARDTARQIERGVLLQQAGAVELALRIAHAEFGRTPRLVLTGGAAAPLQLLAEDVRDAASRREQFLGASFCRVDVEPDLVLQGLAMAVDLLEPR